MDKLHTAIDLIWQAHNLLPDEIVDGKCPRCEAMELAIWLEQLSRVSAPTAAKN